VSDTSQQVVLVRSRYREPIVKVFRSVAIDPNTQKPIEVPHMRQFRDYECYMDPVEAEWLVNSKENQKMRAGGEPSYWYPAGIPVPMDEKKIGGLPPVLTLDQVSVVDPQQAKAAREQLEELQALHDANQALADANKDDAEKPLTAAEKKAAEKAARINAQSQTS